MITVVLVDDQPQVLQGLEMLLALAPDLYVVGTATSGETAIEFARRLRPDVIVMDIRLPGIDGIAATKLLGYELPRTKIIVLSLYDDRRTRHQALLAGAYAFVSKHDMDGPLLATIRRAAQTQHSRE